MNHSQVLIEHSNMPKHAVLIFNARELIDTHDFQTGRNGQGHPAGATIGKEAQLSTLPHIKTFVNWIKIGMR